VKERLYFGAFEIFREYISEAAMATANSKKERQTVHIMDDRERVALVETKTLDTSTPNLQISPKLRFQLTNHLGSACFELDENASVISYEEYHPFGTTAFRAGKSSAEVSLKRYRYTGKERDEETGLYYHGARYHACWLARWTSADPAGLVDGPNLYVYARNNPVRLVDLGGEQSQVGLTQDLQKKLAKAVSHLDPKDREKAVQGLFGLLKHSQQFKGLKEGKSQFDEFAKLAASKQNPIYYFNQMVIAFVTPYRPSGQSSDTDYTKDFEKSFKDAQSRLGTKEGLAHVNDEEKATKDPKRKWTTVKGAGGVTYRVDRSDPKNIHVHIKVWPAGRWEGQGANKKFRHAKPSDKKNAQVDGG